MQCGRYASTVQAGGLSCFVFARNVVLQQTIPQYWYKMSHRRDNVLHKTLFYDRQAVVTTGPATMFYTRRYFTTEVLLVPDESHSDNVLHATFLRQTHRRLIL